MIGLFVPSFFILGLLFGSFLNAALWRARVGEVLSKGRSKCRDCAALIRWHDNIPVVSYLLLRGACRDCKKPISVQYPLVEVAVAILFTFVAWVHGPSDLWLLIRDAAIVWVLVAVFVYDYLYQEILDRFSLVPAALLFFFSLVFGWHTLGSMLLGILVAAGFFLLQFVLSKGAWIGGGDVRFGVLMGVILGFQHTIVALLLAYVIGAVIGVFLLLGKKKGMKSEVAFGTFLAVATLIAMFCGDHIASWYLGIM